jgi:hypothetical protein
MTPFECYELALPRAFLKINIVGFVFINIKTKP